MKRIVLYDTTLRDGAQTEGISLSVTDKLRITEKLDELGVPYVEGGWPGAHPKEMEYFSKVRKFKLKNAQVTAFGSTRRAGRKAASDPLIQDLLKAQTSVITIFGKSWDLHVRDALKTAPEENLRMIRDSVAYISKRKRRVFYDAEHFFDGYRDNPEYALRTLQAAVEAGAEVLVLCDTNGGSLPGFIREGVEAVRSRFRLPVGIHCHNDMELAVANSVAAVEAGAEHVQGTINGYGERCGNANLSSIIPILQLKMRFPCLAPGRLKTLTSVCHYVADVCNMRPEDHQPFVGASAFAHKGGVHINAVRKNPRTYEHVEPESIGNRRRLLVSEMGGKSTILAKAQTLSLRLAKDSEEARKFMRRVQELEAQGFHFEAAEASFDLLMRRAYKRFKRFFHLAGFRVVVEKGAAGEIFSEATVKLTVKGKTEHTAADGDGPVHALDRALRKALLPFFPRLRSMRLTDFKVRDLESQAGTAARVRVLIQTRDAEDSWWTMGVDENIIEASWQALVDSIEYKLLKDKGSGSSGTSRRRSRPKSA